MNEGWLEHVNKVYKLFPLKKSYLIYLLILIIFVSILDLFGISLLIPLVTSLLGNKNDFTTFDKITFISDFEIFNGNTIAIATLMITIFSIKILLTLLSETIILFLSLKSRAILRTNLLKIYVNKDYMDLIKSNSSELINSIQSYTGQHRGTVLNLLKLLNDIIFLFFTFLFVIYFYGSISLLVIFFMIIFILIFDKFTKNYLYKIGVTINKINSKVIKLLSECFYGIKEIKIYKISHYYFNLLRDVSMQQSKIETIYEILGRLPRIFFEYIVILIFLIFAIYSHMTNLELNNILPDFTVIFFLILRLIPLSTSISNNIKTIRHNMNGINNLFENFSLHLEKNLISNTKIKLINSKFQSIEMKNIKFKYSDKNYIFENVNFKIKKGDFIGIIGNSGSGKTTLVDIILGVLKPTSGEILYNNSKINIEDYQSGDFAAYIPQNNFIIDDTIEKNIALDHYKNDINYDILNSVLKKTNLIELIDSLPKKSKTIVGEHGKFLSGGQKQRIAIARALYFNKSLIILDESTNAMNKDLEKSIIDELVKLNNELTIIIITHNSDNLIHCNKIYNIENKKLKEIKKL